MAWSSEGTFVSSDQLTYVLVALIVTGVAILLLLAGALVARRGRGRPPAPAYEPAGPAPAPAFEPATPAPATAFEPQPVAPAPAPRAPVEVLAATEPDETVGFAGPVPTAAPIPASPPAPAHAEPPEEMAVTPAEREAAAQRLHDPREEDVIEGFLSISPPRNRIAAFESGRPPAAVGPVPPAEPPAEAPDEAPAAAPAAVAEPASAAPTDPYIDDVTGLESRAAWDRVLAEENARYVRYRRPVGVVVAEVGGLSHFEREFGPEAAARILVAVGAALRRNARRTDRVAHVGEGRYLVLLPETDEIQAINFVERVRAECDRWLEAGAVALRVFMGWASPSAVGELDTALRTAEERMYAERRRAARAGSADPDAHR